MATDRRTLLRATLGGAVAGAFGIAAPSAAHGRHTPTVYVAGDSTAATYAVADIPRAGWGQALPVFLHPDVPVVNGALSGASSKSFYDLGRLGLILDAIRPGDTFLISFGHNDEKSADPARYTEPWTTFQEYLSLYLDGARDRGAHPVLVTPVERRRFTADGVPYLSHGEYPDAMRALADATDTPLIDLTALSFALWSELGPDATEDYFLWLDAGESVNYPDGVSDNTHFQAHGAIEVARLVVANGHTIPGRDQRALCRDGFPDDILVWPETRPAES
ncbi:rhamnogalacturonan acetylesterase [Actinoplanes sp. NPDC051851]|uniref:rhamnogalacturonan acetylesterase n=1 Tax=Actinoplanes sp. NPDC051851 TaxID=3154753 RepID=UPI003437E319